MTGLGTEAKAVVRGVESIRAFLFDLDGVLWDTNTLHADSFAQVCAEAGLEMPDYERLAGLSTPAAFALVIAEDPRQPGRSVAELTARKRQLFLERIDHVPSDHQALREALDRRRPHSLALVTGASRASAEAYLRRVPSGFFDLVLTADDGLPSKPEPDVYLAAARLLGASPGQCVVFEDSRAGLAGARRAGMRTAHITYAWDGTCDGTACGAEWCAASIVEALEMIWAEQW